MAMSVSSIKTKSMPSRSMNMKISPKVNQQAIPLFIPPVKKNITGKTATATTKHTAIVAFLSLFL